MANKHVHAELAANEYAALLHASQKLSLSTSEAVREATLAWVRSNVPDSEGIVSILDKAAKNEQSGAPKTMTAFVDGRPSHLRPPHRRS